LANLFFVENHGKLAHLETLAPITFLEKQKKISCL